MSEWFGLRSTLLCQFRQLLGDVLTVSSNTDTAFDMGDFAFFVDEESNSTGKLASFVINSIVGGGFA